MAGDRTILERLETPVAAEFDVVVAGGGASGLIAAVSAARAGARTALVERSGCLGGTGTTGMVAQWLGFYNRETRAAGGLAYELAQRVLEFGGSDGFDRYVMAEASSTPLPIVHFSFDPEMVKIACDEFAQDAGVALHFHSQVVRPLLHGGRVGGVIIENQSGRSALRSRIVIDATGDASIAYASGVPCRGEEPELKKRRQPCTLVFRMSNVDVTRFRAIPRDEKRALALEGVRAGRLAWESLSICSTPSGTDAVSLMSRIFEIDALDAADLSRAEVTGRQQIKSMIGFLRERVPGFEKAVLANIAARVAVRETRRIVGQYTLTEEDVLAGKRFPDSIALGAGPMSLHDAQGTGATLWMPELPFEIPLRSLLPQSVDGLIATGRAVSATREANGAARQMATAMCLGEASGVYAALYARGAATLNDASVDRIARLLRERKALVSQDDIRASADDAGDRRLFRAA